MMTSSFHVNYVQWRGFGAIRFTEPSVYSKDSLDVHSKCKLVLWKVKVEEIYIKNYLLIFPKLIFQLFMSNSFVIIGEYCLTLEETYKPRSTETYKSAFFFLFFF